MKNKLLLVILILSLIMCSGCVSNNKPGTNNDAHNNEQAEPDSNQSNEQSDEVPEDTDIVDPLQKQIQEMTIDEKIGQMVMVGIEGLEDDQLSREMIEKYKVGGFILFKRNIGDAAQTLNLINSLKDTNEQNKFPLFFAVDEEGGNVTRMPEEFVKLPTNRSIGRINNEDFSFEIGSAIGKQIKSLGFNMNFAPVLDIDSNPNNPVIGDRSFGPDADIVSRLGIATMKGMQSHVISGIKHFPGHGDTSVDSHIGLPTVDHDLDRLRNFELVPFDNAIQKNADVVMVAHILLSKVDKENPATMSKTVITDFLRNDMEFDGVVITDDMTMGAITENYDVGDAAVKSVKAGVDIILVCHDNEKQIEVIEALKSAAASGVISEDDLNNHVYRILKLKQKYALSDEQTDSADVKGINSEITDILERYMK